MAPSKFTMHMKNFSSTSTSTLAPLRPTAYRELRDSMELDHTTEHHDGEERENPGLEDRTRRKLDMFILPIASVVFFLASMGGNDLQNAKSAGMWDDLGFTEKTYTMCIIAFSAGGLLFQLPGNWLLQIIGPPIQIGGALLGWGIASIGMAFARNYQTVLALRFIISIGEAFISAGILYLSLFYKPRELAFRLGIVWATSCLAGAANGLLAFAMESTLSGALGFKGWQWFLIIGGAMPILWSPVVFIFLPPTPNTVRWWFTNEEKACLVRRSKEGGNSGEHKFRAALILNLLKDPVFWMLIVVRVTFDFGQSAMKNFLMHIIEGLGFVNPAAQAYSMIPYGMAFLTTVSVAWYSDKLSERSYVMVAGAGVSILGQVLNLTLPTPATRFVGTCIFAAGAFPCVLLSLAMTQNMIAGYVQRSTATALISIFSSIAGVATTQVYDDAPLYKKGNTISLILFVAGAAAVLALRFYLKRVNAEKLLAKQSAKASMDRERSIDELGNKHPDFIFLY